MQSLERILSILNILAASPAGGVNLTDLSRRSELDKATTLRILDALCRKRVVRKVSSPKSAKGKLYQLGNELVFLGMAAQRNFTLDDLLRPALQRLTEKTEDTCFITVRNGYNSFCILREMGSYPIQIRSLPVGGCRPLGVGGLGLSILSALPDDEIEEILQKNAEQYLVYPGFTLDFLKDEIGKTRSSGYTFARNHLIDGVYCIAQVVRDPQNVPILSVGIVSVAARIEERRDMLVKAINDTCKEMELLLKTTRKSLGNKMVGKNENHKLFI